MQQQKTTARPHRPRFTPSGSSVTDDAQQSTPRSGTEPVPGASAPSSSRKKSSKAFAQSAPDETIFVPPASMFILGGLGVLVGVGANFWQMFTSFSAFEHIFLTGSIFQHMSSNARDAALPVINIVCALIAISFQLAILFLVFRIERTWKETKAVSGNNAAAAKHTAVEVVQHVPIVLIWGALGFIADTVGDYTFISLYSTDTFILFMYGASLYASSTIMLARAIEYIWSGVISYEQFKAFKSRLHGGGSK